MLNSGAPGISEHIKTSPGEDGLAIALLVKGDLSSQELLLSDCCSDIELSCWTTCENVFLFCVIVLGLLQQLVMQDDL